MCSQRRRARCGSVLEEKPSQQVAGSAQAIRFARAHVVQRFEVLLERGDRGGDLRVVPAAALQRGFREPRTRGNYGHAAVGKTRGRHLPTVD